MNTIFRFIITVIIFIFAAYATEAFLTLLITGGLDPSVAYAKLENINTIFSALFAVIVMTIPILLAIFFYNSSLLKNFSISKAFIKKSIAIAIFVFKILVCLIVPLLILNLLLSNTIRISDNACCGLNAGDIVRWKEFDPTILQRGDVVFYKDSQKVYFSRIIAFPGEYVFSDLYAGRWGYTKKTGWEEKWEEGIAQDEISELFYSITWLDLPTFQATVQSENIHDRLRLNNFAPASFEDIVKNYYKHVGIIGSYNEVNITHPEQIYGIYDSVFVTADNVIFYNLALIFIYLLLFFAIYNILSRILKKKHIIHSANAVRRCIHLLIKKIKYRQTSGDR